MKTLKLFFLPFLFLILAYSCQKVDQNITDIPNDTNYDLRSLDIPAGFNWGTTADYDFYITGGSGQTVKITSEDGSVTYHKGTYIETNGSYKVSLRIPTSVNSVRINYASVDLTGSDINHDLSTKSTYKLTNYALSFDGVDDVVNLGDISELNNVAAFTVEGWANQASNTDTETIFYKAADGSNDIQISTNGGTMYVDVGNGSDSYATWANYSATITSSTWFHWALVFDGSGGTNADRLKLYINGNTTPITLSFTGTIPATTSSSLSGVDAYLSAASTPFGGYMDEVRIWSVARSGAEIAANYNELISGSTSGLVADWRMDEGEGTTLYDQTSNDYDATISGCSWALYSNGWDSDGDGITDLNDDYPFEAQYAYENFYPAADTGTLVFEDLWPSTGDYDFNDLVLGYRFKTITSATNAVVSVTCYFELRAHGAALLNGFGFQLPDAAAGILSDVQVNGYSHTQGTITIDGTTHFETGQSKPVVIVMDLIAAEMGLFQNTMEFKPTIPYVPLTLTMNVLANSYTLADFSLDTWNPFMYVGQTRGYEVHKLDYPPTDLVNPIWYGTLEDVSDPGNNEYYRTATGLPWALEFPSTFEYPFEYASIMQAYLHFQEWAESGGTLYTDWYSNTAVGYRNTTYIYN